MKYFLACLLAGLWPTMSIPKALMTTGETGNVLALRNKEDWVGVIGSCIAHFAQPSEEFRQATHVANFG